MGTAIASAGTASAGGLSAATSATPTAMTVALFVKLKASAADFTALAVLTSTTTNYYLETKVNGTTMEFSPAGGGTTPIVTGASLSVNVWTFIAFTLNSSQNTATVYSIPITPGAVLSSASGATGVATATPPATIRFAGDQTGGGTDSSFNGSICGAKFWTRDLSAAEILAESRQLNPVVMTDDLYEYWSLTDPSNLTGLKKRITLIPNSAGQLSLDQAGPSVPLGVRPNFAFI